MSCKEQMLKEVYDTLHVSAQTRQEVLSMKQENKAKHFAGKRVLVAVLAAVLALALAVSAMAAAGVFRMNIREANPGEVFAGPSVQTRDGEYKAYHWEGAKLVFNFDGPSECSRIHVKPGYLPYEISDYFSWADGDGWYRCISCEGSNGGGRSNQPCRIDVRYAPMFVDGGNLLLLYADDVTGIDEEDWNGYHTFRFQSRKARSDGSELYCSYFILYQPEQGYIVTISSMEDNLDELEQIAKNLEIEQTGEIVGSADYNGHNEFLDCGVG